MKETIDVEPLLPDPLPLDPVAMLKQWQDDAWDVRAQPNPHAIALATVDPDGAPSVRIVLCKVWNVEAGWIGFHTNRESRKGRALAAHPHAAADFFWDHQGRQAIIEGPVVQAPEADSDAYFKTRPLARRLGAWVSDQSRPIESRDKLMAKLEEVMERFGVTNWDQDVDIPRPPHWGGYRIWARRVELWINGEGRIHDRAQWSRELTPDGADGFTAGPWSSTRLQP